MLDRKLYSHEPIQPFKSSGWALRQEPGSPGQRWNCHACTGERNGNVNLSVTRQLWLVGMVKCLPVMPYPITIIIMRLTEYRNRLAAIFWEMSTTIACRDLDGGRIYTFPLRCALLLFPSCPDCDLRDTCDLRKLNEGCWGWNPSCADCLVGPRYR